MHAADKRPSLGGVVMRFPKRTVKSAMDACQTISRPAWHYPLGDGYATPWDEPARDWGRGHGPLRAVRKMFRREKLLGTW